MAISHSSGIPSLSASAEAGIDFSAVSAQNPASLYATSSYTPLDQSGTVILTSRGNNGMANLDMTNVSSVSGGLNERMVIDPTRIQNFGTSNPNLTVGSNNAGLILSSGTTTTINATTGYTVNLNGVPKINITSLGVATFNGNATTATTATNLAGGLGGSIPYQSAVNTTALLANGTSGQYLKSNGTTLAPSWITPSAISNLDGVLFNGNTATGTYANINLIDTDTGGQANPIMTLQNTNATGSVALEIYKNKPTAGIAGDVLFNQSAYGKSSTLAKKEFTRITHTIRDPLNGVEDGSIEMGCFVNGVFTNILQLNGNENETNLLKPLDMNGNNIRSSTGDLNLTTALAVGTGAIGIATKTTAGTTFTSSLGTPATQYIKINPCDFSTPTLQNSIVLTSTDGAGFTNSINLINNQSTPYLQLKRDFGSGINKSITMGCATSGAGQNYIQANDSQLNLPFLIDSNNGSLELKTGDATGDLIFTGTNLESNIASAGSGIWLKIILNGQPYRIQLYNP